jgi:endonuclease/exonuclease/phosphatase family metal-dependent hydrolase
VTPCKQLVSWAAASVAALPLRRLALSKFAGALSLLLVFCALAQAAEQVRVMQWNVQSGLGNISLNNSEAAQAIARIVNYNQPDILLFCEVTNAVKGSGGVAADTTALINWVTNYVSYLGTQPGVTFYVAVSSATDTYIRNGAISRYPILNETTYSDGMRGLHAFRVQLATTNLQVFHAHLKCCSDGTSCTTKQTQAQFDATTISAWASTNSSPYLFAGDWNEDEDSRDTPECAITTTYHPITTIEQVGGLSEFEPTTLSGEWRTWSTAAAPSIRFDYVLPSASRLSGASGFVFSTMDWAAHGFYTNVSTQNLVNDSQTASDHFCVFADYSFSTTTASLGVTPMGALASAGSAGGSFSPASQVYGLTNTGSGSLNWTASKTANWVTLSATSGTLSAGAGTNVTVSINAGANSLPAGTYSDTVSFTNTSNGTGNTMRAVSLIVTAPVPVGSFGFSDDFGTYAPGNLVGQSNWVQFSTPSATPLQVSGGKLAVVGGQTNDTQDAYKNFAQTNITLFYGLTLTVNGAINNTNPSYFTALYTSNNAAGFANFRLTAKAGDTYQTNCVLGVRVTGQTVDPYTFGSTALSTGTQCRVIVQAPAGYASALLYVNPTSADLAAQIPYASNPIGTGTPPASLGSAVLSQYGTASIPTDGVSIGKLVVSDNYAAVYHFLTATPFENWQTSYFGSTTNLAAASTADPDNDGMSNWAEFLAGTNPTNSASVFRLAKAEREGDNLRVSWTTGSGRTNVLQRAAGAGSAFADISTIVTSGATTNYVDVGAATNASAWFYRVLLAP